MSIGTFTMTGSHTFEFLAIIKVLTPFPQGESRPMKLTVRIPVTAGLLAFALLSATGCKRLSSNDQLNKGVAAFKNAKYEEATDHFQKAVQIDPENANAAIYLCTAYSSQLVPNLDTPENKALATKALDCFRAVLEKNPNSVIALKQIASIDRNTAHPEEAKEFEKKVIGLAPNDYEAYYTVGVVDWLQAYKHATDILAAQTPPMTDKSDGNIKLPKPACAQLATQNTALVTEGTQYLQKAIDLNPTYEEAMTYMSLMARRKADLECGNTDAIKADLASADEWAKKSMGARAANEKKKEEKLKGGVTQ
jgi:tetratricopeptide (TPR) repeat protein